MDPTTDAWVTGHQGYSGDQPLARRLWTVQDQIRAAFDRLPPGPIRLVSLCAGDGRDLLGVLADHPRAGDVRARRVELTPELAEAARARSPSTGPVARDRP